MSETDMRFVGWHQSASNQPWCQVVEAETEEEALELLDARVDGGKTVVLPAGEHPLHHKHPPTPPGATPSADD
jgi:hypothetical protein